MPHLGSTLPPASVLQMKRVDPLLKANNWAQAMIGRPGVHVAESTAEVMRLVEAITADPGRIDAMLAPATAEWG